MAGNLIENDQIIEMLSLAIVEGGSGLSQVPALMKRVVKEGSWRERIIRKTGQTVKFERFIDFVTAEPLAGLGASVRAVQELCATDNEALSKFDAALLGEDGDEPSEIINGGDRRSKNFSLRNTKSEIAKAPAGDNKRTALRRLRKDRPDLHERVIAQELSPHAAMMEAGFRKARVTIRMDDPASAAQTILKHMELETFKELMAILNDALAHEQS